MIKEDNNKVRKYIRINKEVWDDFKKTCFLNRILMQDAVENSLKEFVSNHWIDDVKKSKKTV